jgi:hypothetical protein
MQVWKMHHYQTGWFIVALFIAIGVIGSLAAVALPHANEMAYHSEAEKRETEMLRIKSAVADMLQASACGKLEPAGLVTDLSQVMTRDDFPLVLSDFLPDGMNAQVTSGYRYSFSADGIVLQYEMN